MVKCAFCDRDLDKGAVPCFSNPSRISPAAKQVWLHCSEAYRKRTNKTELGKYDRVCQSHFADDAKRRTDKKWKLRENAVPTIGVDYEGPSILPLPPPPPTMNSVIETPKRQTLTMRNSPAKVTIKPILPGQNPFQCNFCPDNYEKESTLNYHIKTRHQKEVVAAAKVEILSIENIDYGKIPGSVTQDENANELYDTVEEACDVKVNVENELEEVVWRQIKTDTVEEVCEAAEVEASNEVEVVNGENELDETVDEVENEVAGQVVHEENVEYENVEYLEELDETVSKVEREIENANFENELEAGDGKNEPEELSDAETSDDDVNAARVSEGMLKNGKKLRNLTHAPTTMSRLGKMAHKRKHSK